MHFFSCFGVAMQHTCILNSKPYFKFGNSICYSFFYFLPSSWLSNSNSCFDSTIRGKHLDYLPFIKKPILPLNLKRALTLLVLTSDYARLCKG
ncbi:hypothetical protein VIGAN_04274400 [Vigna angularis var. angularis]|uniref:Uncharacterized protein n=1 Tax=Vigna angularis var. angularis TaxID=157739 RepID=A0A0S3RXA1_PHAAN|nr:hypothetical protein VIGAN_04274400 [Vigna angularis var. angularis]